MLQANFVALALVALVGIVNISGAQGQLNPRKTCQNATGLSAINATLFGGKWYEVIQAPAANASCVEIEVSLINNRTQLDITTHYSVVKNGLLVNEAIYMKVNTSSVNNTHGFNVTYSNSKVNTTLKVLSANSSSNVVLCGFTNMSDPETSFGIILTRSPFANPSWLMELNKSASGNLSVFSDVTAANITHSKVCRKNSAATSLPALATTFAALYALLKLSY